MKDTRLRILCGSIYMKFKSRIMSLGIESRLVVARVVRMLVELNEGNFHYSWRGEGWRGYKALERFLCCWKHSISWFRYLEQMTHFPKLTHLCNLDPSLAVYDFSSILIHKDEDIGKMLWESMSCLMLNFTFHEVVWALSKCVGVSA